MTTPFFTITTALLSILTSWGVVLHDIRAEQVLTQTTVPIVSDYRSGEELAAEKPLSAGQHVHIDYNPLSQALSHAFAYQDPSIAPRRESHHKHLLREIEAGGRHAFGNANLPIIEA